jgi:GxxExxY protein
MQNQDHRDSETQSSQRNDLVEENKITEQIIGCTIEVHKQLGPGLLESIYEVCLCKEFKLQGLKYSQQKELPIVYKKIELPERYRVDLIVEDKIVVEIKCVESILPVHQAQVLTYLRLTGFNSKFLYRVNEKRYKASNFIKL